MSSLSRQFVQKKCNCIKNLIRRQVATLVDGKQVAKELQIAIKADISKWIDGGKIKPPMLVAILVGDDPASATYVSHKMKTAKFVGVESQTETYPGTLQEDELLRRIDDLNRNDNVDGILVQLPLPVHIDSNRICRSIDPEKDVDGFSALNMGELCLGREALYPCTPLGVVELIKRTGLPTHGKNAAIFGRSKNVGLPIALLLQSPPVNTTVTICHRFTPKDELKNICRSADFLVVATGVPGLITADMIKPGSCVIDVGITRIIDEKTGAAKLIGDVDFARAKEVAGFITPVPGGVGPMTVTMLMKNTFLAAQRRRTSKNV